MDYSNPVKILDITHTATTSYAYSQKTWSWRTVLPSYKKIIVKAYFTRSDDDDELNSMTFMEIPINLLDISKIVDIRLVYNDPAVTTPNTFYYIFRPFYNSTSGLIAARFDIGSSATFTAHGEVYGIK